MYTRVSYIHILYYNVSNTSRNRFIRMCYLHLLMAVLGKLLSKISSITLRVTLNKSNPISFKLFTVIPIESGY